MKKIKLEWFIILALVIIIASIVLPKELNDLDEIWNYNFARNIAEGKLPYKDFNMIVMPFLPSICAVFLLIFGNEILIMRILAVILCVAVLYMSYKVLETMKTNKQIGVVFLLALVYLFKEHFRIDYNFFVLFNILAIIYIELTKTKEHPILLGILAGICICSKQTTGIMVSIVLIGYRIFEVSNKEEFKAFLKDSLHRLIGILIPIVVLCVYFTMTGIWADFIDYCIEGIGTFANLIPYSNLIESENVIIKILAIMVPMYILLSAIMIIVQKLRHKSLDRNILVVTSYSISSIIVAYPISDEIHFLIGSLPALIGIVYVLNLLIRKIEMKKSKMFLNEFLKVATILGMISISAFGVKTLYEYIKIASNYKEFNHFNYIPQPEGQTEDIQEITEYIKSQEKEVYVLDAVAALYNIPIDRYVKNYDMFNRGNIGGSGENGIIKNLQNESNIIILIRNENYDRNWQNPERVREYVIENINKVGEINIFDIYEK